MSTAQVNGDVPSSLFLQHLTSYPVASDLISTFKSNAYGQKSISIADQTYARFAKPFLPYLAGPYEYISPYVRKADSLADNGLNKVDSTFPVVTKPTDEVKGNIIGIAHVPLDTINQGKTYVFDVYGSEYKKTGDPSIVNTGKALVLTGIVVTTDSVSWLSSFLGAKKQQTKEVAQQKLNN